MKSSPLIWPYVVNVKSTVQILSIIMAFLENMNFKREHGAEIARKIGLANKGPSKIEVWFL